MKRDAYKQIGGVSKVRSSCCRCRIPFLRLCCPWQWSPHHYQSFQKERRRRRRDAPWIRLRVERSERESRLLSCVLDWNEFSFPNHSSHFCLLLHFLFWYWIHCCSRKFVYKVKPRLGARGPTYKYTAIFMFSSSLPHSCNPTAAAAAGALLFTNLASSCLSLSPFHHLHIPDLE